MNEIELKEFFMLENDENGKLFQQAITPKSCGGGNEFELLALLGDRALNLELSDILIEEGISDTGTLTTRVSNYIHNKEILSKVGKILKLDEIMSPVDFKQVIQKKDLAEFVEALIGANFKAHGFGPHNNVIRKLYNLIKKIVDEIQKEIFTNLLLGNPKGKLLELFQKHDLPDPKYETTSVGLIEGQPPFKCVLPGNYLNHDNPIESGENNSKIDAEKEAAVKFLMAVRGETDFEEIMETNEIVIKKKDNINQDLIPEEISLVKLSSQGQPEEIRVSSDTGETMHDWAIRKASKGPFTALILLSHRLDDFSGCSWHASIPQGELFFSYNKLDGKDYFEIGFGDSKTKAKKDVANKFIKSSQLFKWLKEKHGDTLI